MNPGGGACSEPEIRPLHSSLGDRARPRLKKKKKKERKTDNTSDVEKHFIQNKETIYKMGENIQKLCIQQKYNNQNLQDMQKI